MEKPKSLKCLCKVRFFEDRHSLLVFSVLLITMAFFALKLFYMQKVEIKSVVKKCFDLSMNGMRGYYYNNQYFEGTPLCQAVDNDIDDKTFTKKTGRETSFSIKWQGVFYSGKKCKYKFCLNSDDGSCIYIDHALVVDNWGIHPEKIVKKTVAINKGWHSIEIIYRQYTGLCKMEFYWQDLKDDAGKQSSFSAFCPPYSEQKFKEFLGFSEDVKKWKHYGLIMVMAMVLINIVVYLRRKILSIISRVRAVIKKALYNEFPIYLVKKETSMRNKMIDLFIIFARKVYFFMRRIPIIIKDAFIYTPFRGLSGKVQVLCVLAVFLIAFINIFSYYLKNPYVYCSNLGTGSDFHVYFTNSMTFADYLGNFHLYHGDPAAAGRILQTVFFTVGSAGLIIPFLGMFFKLFCIYPGIFYFCISEIIMSSIVCVIPFLITKSISKKISFGGLLAGLWLAFNPLIIKVTPLLATDALGLFVLSMSMLFLYRVIYNRKIFDYIFFGIFCFLLMITRHVLIAVGIVIVLFYVGYGFVHIYKKIKSGRFRLFSKVLGRDITIMLVPLLILTLSAICYDQLYVRKNTGNSLILYNITSGMPFLKGSIDIQQKGLLEAFHDMIKQKYKNVETINKLIVENALFQSGLLWKILLIVLTLYILLAIFYSKYLHLIPILLVGIAYYALLCMTYLNHRYLLLLIFLLSIFFAFIMEFCISTIFIIGKRHTVGIRKVFIGCFTAIILVSFYFLGRSFCAGNVEYKTYKDYLKWVGSILPENSIILTEAEANPWLICELTGKAVAHNVPYGGSIFVDRVPWRVCDCKITSTMMLDKGIEGTGNVLNIFVRNGRQLILLDTKFVGELEKYYLRNQDAFALKGNNNRKIALYRSRTTKGKYKSVYLLTKD